MLRGDAPASTAPPPAAPAPRTLFPIVRGLAGGFTDIRVERVALTPSTVTLLDDGVRPPARLVVSKLEGQLDGLTWPVKGPATLRLAAGLPGGGTVRIAGPLTVYPFDVELTVAVRDAPVEPYQAYIPIPARL